MLISLNQLSSIILSSNKIESNYDICTLIYYFYINLIPKINYKIGNRYIRLYKNDPLYFFVDKVIRLDNIVLEKYHWKKGHYYNISYPHKSFITNRKIDYGCYENEMRRPTYEESIYMVYCIYK